MKTLTRTLLLLCASATVASAATTLAQWTFEATSPTTAGPFAPEVGTGTAIGGTGGTYSSPAGWGTAEVPSAKSWSSNGWDVGDYYQFQVSTTGWAGISVNFQHTGSNTGPANFALLYSLDGENFTQLGTHSVTNDSWNTLNSPAASVKSFVLTDFTALNDAVSVFFRVSMTDTVSINGGTVAGTGTSRVDNFTITAETSTVPEPSAFAAVAGLAALGGAALRRRRRSALAG